MGWLDSVSDFFGFSSGPSIPSNPQPAPAYDPGMPLNNTYRLADLTKTTQSLQLPNIPAADYMIQNLKISADILDYLASRVGPFQVISGFRTKELQDILAAQGEPTAKGLSFHEVGRGFDIYPTTMNIEEFMGLILAQEDVQNQFAEIAIKPSQNSIHLATNVPGDIRTPKITNLDESGNYIQMTADQIARYIEPYVESVDAAYYQAASLVTLNRAPMMLAAVAALAGGAYLIFSSKSKVRANPYHESNEHDVPKQRVRYEKYQKLKMMGFSKGKKETNPRLRKIQEHTLQKIEGRVKEFSTSKLRHYCQQLRYIQDHQLYNGRRDKIKVDRMLRFAQLELRKRKGN